LISDLGSGNILVLKPVDLIAALESSGGLVALAYLSLTASNILKFKLVLHNFPQGHLGIDM
jgi:hypothetical protein